MADTSTSTPRSMGSGTSQWQRTRVSAGSTSSRSTVKGYRLFSRSTSPMGYRAREEPITSMANGVVILPMDATGCRISSGRWTSSR